jgi:hypothetical protein
VNLFLDANVALAACGRPSESRAIFDLAPRNGWTLMISGYVIAEVTLNLPRLGAPTAGRDWGSNCSPYAMYGQWTDPPSSVRPKTGQFFYGRSVVASITTLDRGDFGAVMGGRFYRLDVLTPGDFLERERSAGRLK